MMVDTRMYIIHKWVCDHQLRIHVKNRLFSCLILAIVHILFLLREYSCCLSEGVFLIIIIFLLCLKVRMVSIHVTFD